MAKGKKEKKERKFKLAPGHMFRRPIGFLKKFGEIRMESALKKECGYIDKDIEYMLREKQIVEI